MNDDKHSLNGMSKVDIWKQKESAKGDNPPVRFGGRPTIFSWCSKEGERRAYQETENLANANISSQNAANQARSDSK